MSQADGASTHIIIGLGLNSSVMLPKKKPENLSNQTSKIIKTDGEEWKNVLCRRPSARSTFQREQELDSTRYLSTEALLWASVALFKSHSFTVT